MNRMTRWLPRVAAALLALTVGLAGPGAHVQGAPGTQALTPLTLVLDWFPNTNHLGVYLAQANGWYPEQGIDLRIEAPSDVNAATKLTATGNAEVGISYQPAVTFGRAQDIPVVSIAALVQHNLGAFAAKQESGIARPADFEGKKYGSSGVPQSMAQLRTVMRCDGADPSRVEEVTLGQQIAPAMMANRVDFMALLWTWEGIQLEMSGTPLTYLHYRDWCLPDTYNLVFISGEQTIRSKPDALRGFLAATRRGYEAAVVDQESAIVALLAAAPDLDPALVRASTERLTAYFLDESGRWGTQEESRWTAYAAWALENGLIARPVDGAKAFTAELLGQ